MRLKRGERRRTLVQLALHYRGDLLHRFEYPDVLTAVSRLIGFRILRIQTR